MTSLYVDKIAYQLKTPPPDNPIALRYLELLLAGDSHAARRLILDAIQQGSPVKTLYTEVFQWSQWEIGHLWETGQINVADEHYTTATTQSLMAQLYPYIAPESFKDKKALITCVPDELHEIGARMVADFLTMDGWDTDFLGANTPTESLIKRIRTARPDLLAISVTMTHHLSQMMDLVEKVKASPDASAVKILVGGRPFLISPDLCKNFSLIDGCMSTGGDVVYFANRLVGEGA